MTSERPKVERLTILVNLKFSFREQNAFAYDNYAATKVGRFTVIEKVFFETKRRISKRVQSSLMESCASGWTGWRVFFYFFSL